MTAFAPRPTQPVALATVTPAVDAAVRAWQDACRTRDAFWQELERHAKAHRTRQAIADNTGRKIRRSAAYRAADSRFDHVEHKAARAEAEIEMQLRIANPAADNRSIMATKRELTRTPL